MTRRDFLRISMRFTGTFAVVTTGGLGYSMLVEPYMVDTERIEIPLQHLPLGFDGMTIVQISDLHFGTWLTAEHMLGVVEKINALDVDIIVITGDFVSGFDSEIEYDLVSSLSMLQAREGVYAILGNHDHWAGVEAVSDAIQNAGIRLLINESVLFERNYERLYLAGLGDIWEDKQDLEGTLRDIPEDECVVMLVHEPDYADYVAMTGRVDLQLSGHTHGGQVRMPFTGANVLPALGRKYDMGLYSIDDLILYVNRGLGMMKPAIRFRCTPEITHITLRSIV